MSERKSMRHAAYWAGGLAGACVAFGAVAQSAPVQPQAIVVFSGVGQTEADDTGAAPGRWMRVPPTFGPDGRLHGMTAGSSFFFDSRWFSVGTDGKGYSKRLPSGEITTVPGPMVSVSHADTGLMFGAATKVPFQLTTDQQVQQLVPKTAAGTPLQVSAFLSSVAAGSQGAVFFSARTGNSPQIWRRLWDGSFELIADFALPDYVTYRELLPGIRQVDRYLKGNNTVGMVWSEADQALYGVTEDSAYDGKSGNSATVVGDLAVGTVYRIRAADFKADGTSSIEILHTFGARRDGAAKTLVYRAPALLEVGEWLYGTSTVGTRIGNANDSQDGRVWRLRKDCVSTAEVNCLEVVYRFDTAGVASTTQGGTLPLGPLVYAADGNVYGTTLRGGTSATNEKNGQGTLFRISNPTAAALSDVVLTQVHAFDTATTGNTPSGLALAGKANGKQRIVGVTEQGGNATDTYSAQNGSGTGFGTIFAFDVDLPAATITAFTVNDAARVSVQEGAKVKLAWQSNGAAVCEASGDWQGAQQVEGGVEIGPLAYRAQAYEYTLICRSADGVASVPQQVTVSVTQTPETTEPVTPGDGGNNQGGDSGGGGGGSLPWQVLALLPLALLRRRASAK